MAGALTLARPRTTRRPGVVEWAPAVLDVAALAGTSSFAEDGLKAIFVLKLEAQLEL